MSDNRSNDYRCVRCDRRSVFITPDGYLCPTCALEEMVPEDESTRQDG